jgi:response regulator RpfG family c-di-GMP phosphodiesterase
MKRLQSLSSNQNFDIIISDYNMPDGNGGELFSYMKSAQSICPLHCFQVKVHPIIMSLMVPPMWGISINLLRMWKIKKLSLLCCRTLVNNLLNHTQTSRSGERNTRKSYTRVFGQSGLRMIHDYVAVPFSYFENGKIANTSVFKN